MNGVVFSAKRHVLSQVAEKAATVVSAKEKKEGVDFFPLTVDYEEKMYAAGKIPGGFIKREGRPTEKMILSSRLIDRPIRPLFPEGFRNDVQVVCYVVSHDRVNDSDIPAMIGKKQPAPQTSARKAGDLRSQLNFRNPLITELLT